MKTYAVIGDPIDHSLSPSIHNAAFKSLGIDATYIAYRIRRGELEDGVRALKKIGIDGFNVTVPHKTEIMKLLDRTDEACSAIGAANTVTYADGVLKGYNTDMGGFLDPIRRRSISVKGKAVLLLGAGGAARAVAAGLVKEGAGPLTIRNRTASKAEELIRFVQNLGGTAGTRPRQTWDIIVNATTLGMQNETIPIPQDAISRDTTVYDIVYKPINTNLINAAKRAGATAIYGYEMLIGQAVLAFQIWHGTSPYDIMKQALVGVQK